MGHYCWMCERDRPNEGFSGKGHRRHICKKCMRRPRAERDRIRAMNDIYGFLEQRNISAKNMARLEELRDSPDSDVRVLAELLLDVARVKSHRRKRWGYLRTHRPDLVARAVELGLLHEWIETEPDLAFEAEAAAEAEIDPEVFASGPNDAELPF